MKFSIKAAKANFFDRDAVIRAVGKARVRVLSKAGAFVRQTAKKSIRKAPKASGGPQGRNVKGQFLKVKRTQATSKPGSPPYSHLGLIQKFLFFAYDSGTETVVIGPTLINKPTGAPETLEYGGDTTVEEHRFVTTGGHRKYVTTKRPIHIEPRPYMGPALRAEAPNFAGLWRNSVR